jgi:riboflavin kinase
MAKGTKITQPPHATAKRSPEAPRLLKKIKLIGEVFSGRGEGTRFLELPWVKRQIKEKLGFIPYHGTLNLRLSEGSAKRRKLLEKATAMQVCPAEGYCSGKIFKASVGLVECAVVVPEAAGYPENVLEIIASANLREKLQVADGDEITVTVNL